MFVCGQPCTHMTAPTHTCVLSLAHTHTHTWLPGQLPPQPLSPYKASLCKAKAPEVVPGSTGLGQLAGRGFPSASAASGLGRQGVIRVYTTDAKTQGGCTRPVH